MDNNSTDTLFGFTAVTDMFTENGGQDTPFVETNNNEDIDDDTLEELKRDSAKHRPATPGSKDKGENKDNKSAKESTDEDIETVEEDSVEEHAEDDIEDASITSDEPADEESTQVTALFDAIAEELSWEFTDEEKEEKPKTVEELVTYFANVIKEQSVPEYASEDIAKLDEFVRNGGDLREYFSTTTEVDLENINMDDESNQKLVLKELLTRKGYSDKQINKKIERFEDAGVLEDEANDAIEELRELTERDKKELLEEQKKAHDEFERRQQKFYNDVVNEIKTLDDIRGIKIPSKDKKELLAYIFKADADGRTQYQKDYSKSVKNLIESAYFTMRGDTLIESAKKQGTSSAIKNLKNSLRSTSASKGTKRINTSSSNSIFSRAVQLL